MSDHFQPNASVNVHRDGDTIIITHMNRLGSRHVIPLSITSALMLSDELFQHSRPDFNAEPSTPTKDI